METAVFATSITTISAAAAGGVASTVPLPLLLLLVLLLWFDAWQPIRFLMQNPLAFVIV